MGARNRKTDLHYTTNVAARLDRIYLTEGLHRKKQGIETIAVAFSDHMAVLLRINLSIPFYTEDAEGGK